MSLNKWQSARNILCIRLDYLGDVLMCTPAIRALKQSAPGRRVTLLTSRSGAAAARFIPELDAWTSYAAPWMKSSAAHAPEADLELVEALRAERFDAAVIFTTYSQNPLPSAMLCYLAGIPLRLAHCHENPYQLLSDWVRDPEPQECIRHEARRQLDLVAEIGCTTNDERLSFQVPAADAAGAARCLQDLGISPGSRWIALHPGATAPSRRYPPELWAQAADALVRRFSCPVLFTGGKDEVTLVESIRRGMQAESLSLAGRLELGQLAAVIASAPVMVSGNTGPAHIAAAAGTPIVDLYALTNPQHTPWRVASRVLYQDVSCRNCYKSVCPHGHNLCLTGIETERIVDAVAELLGESRSASALTARITTQHNHSAGPRTVPIAARGSLPIDGRHDSVAQL